MTRRALPVAVALAFAWAAAYAVENTETSAPTTRDAGTVDVTTIEGEIPLPQVWFFSSRERLERFDQYHFAYLKSFAQIGNELGLAIRLLPASEEPEIPEGF